ncbi:hypothetical protein CC2G_008849 [Coprinopsis cinerea AmutBmut pab1-1]|nr:hypothetical protein CC2G_008849 [Coprinopsis cinerea AmutBmut pab1-1]
MSSARAIRLALVTRNHRPSAPLQRIARSYATTPGTPGSNSSGSSPGPHHHKQSATKSVAPKPSPNVQKSTSPVPTPPGARHEVHEGTAALSAPYNPPGGGGPGAGGGGFTFTNSPVLDAVLTTFIGLGAVFFGGIAYMRWYKANVLDKIEEAFKAGYDPALELAKAQPGRKSKSGDDDDDPFDSDEPWTGDLRRKEQDLIDMIVHGEEAGHYFMLLGPKGSGKGTMIFDSMAANQADGVSFCDAHPDLEVFRLRLGKALNYEFNEDTQTGLFQRRDPREGGAPLDIERALNKLEKVALQAAKDRGKPWVLIINNIHYFQNDDEGRNFILQLQQKAEAWAASGILTLVFSSDEFWPFHVMRKSGSRMHVISVEDLKRSDAMQALARMRAKAGRPKESPETINETLDLVGGRLSYLSKVKDSFVHRVFLINHDICCLGRQGERYGGYGQALVSS